MEISLKEETETIQINEIELDNTTFDFVKLEHPEIIEPIIIKDNRIQLKQIPSHHPSLLTVINYILICIITFSSLLFVFKYVYKKCFSTRVVPNQNINHRNFPMAEINSISSIANIE